MQDLYGSHTVCASARPARENEGRENEGFELRAMCMDTAGYPTQPYKTDPRNCNTGSVRSTTILLISIPTYARKILLS